MMTKKEQRKKIVTVTNEYESYDTVTNKIVKNYLNSHLYIEHSKKSQKVVFKLLDPSCYVHQITHLYSYVAV